ncbi:ABC transporter ATP-binding protein [Aerococcaceae bacterium DSM 111176]|nr:ABC transporter ATP-binding protein [Aerococcaceae bacterium DSM 111176]
MANTQTPVIEMRQISKQFGDFYANKDINLELRKGEIHALLGENGAGKSTLMNMLSGLLMPSSGQILMNGEPVSIDSPTKANNIGIGMVHQHFMLIQAFTVLENIILGAEETSGLTLDKKSSIERLDDLSKRYGLAVDANAVVRDISVGMQQRVEILKVLYRGAEVLIFDEPTASLTPQEIDDLMITLKALAKEGKSIIIITHKLDEIKAVADRCTVIRRGESIDTVEVADVTSKELADMMVGRSVSFKTDKTPANPQEVALNVENISVKDSRGITVVDDLSFNVRDGEIVGIAGVDGNGQTELILTLNGLMEADSGKITFKGEDITNSDPRSLFEKGLSHIPEDRHKHGVILDFAVEENMVLKNYYRQPFSNKTFMQFKAIEEYANELIEQYDVRTTSSKATARSLSGGNQQKAIIARELRAEPEFLSAANPTRGLDVGAIEFIHKAIIDERDKGNAVLLMSFELDEIMNLSDRIIVMYGGKIVADIPASETNEQELGQMMAGTPYSEVVAQRGEGSVVNE